MDAIVQKRSEILTLEASRQVCQKDPFFVGGQESWLRVPGLKFVISFRNITYTKKKM
jgi:hypothetical protein